MAPVQAGVASGSEAGEAGVLWRRGGIVTKNTTVFLNIWVSLVLIAVWVVRSGMLVRFSLDACSSGGGVEEWSTYLLANVIHAYTTFSLHFHLPILTLSCLLPLSYWDSSGAV